MKRREFIILTSVGAASAGVLSSCGHPDEKLIPVFVPDDEYIPGIDYWKASTCGMCSAGCGIVVRTREHKANKIEGNPQHPLNNGALCARGQAGLQLLYNPDRIRGPLKLTGSRGSGEFASITWEEAVKTLATKLREAKGQRDSIAFATTRPHGVTGLAAEVLAAACDSKHLIVTGLSNEPETLASYRRSYGVDGIPLFDIANATYLLSFGARFLETWHSPVMYSLAYAEFRRSAGRVRGKLVQVEPRMSLTGGNADEWLPAATGTEGLLALAIAQVISRENLGNTAAKPSFLSSSLDDYAPEKIAERIDIPAEKIMRIAREFAKSERPLAIAGGSAGDLDAIHYLNRVVGNIGKSGGVITEAAAQFDPLSSFRAKPANWSSSIEVLAGSGQVKALLVHHSNPAYERPATIESLRAIPFIASFSTLMDETTRMADLVLPDSTYLESWDLKASYPSTTKRIVTLSAPVVTPEFDTRQTADVLIATLREMGEATQGFESSEAIVRKATAALRSQSGSITAENDDDFWTAFAERGVWSSEQPAKPKTAPAANGDRKQGETTKSPAIESVAKQSQAESSSEFPLTLLAYEHAALGFGEHSNLPALQELPDPMTSVIWGSWVEINPKTASSLGVADGDLVEVRTAHGSVRVPAIVHQAIRPDVIAMPAGQGHTSHGSYSQNKGANVAALFPKNGDSFPQPGLVNGAISKVPGDSRLVRFGTNLPERPETHR